MIEQLSLLDEGARPTWGPLGAKTADVVDLVGNDPRKDEDYERFLAACRFTRGHDDDGAEVSINAVRSYLTGVYGLIIEPRRYSSFWRRARLDGHLSRTGKWETNTDSKGRNAGKPQPIYRWVGAL